MILGINVNKNLDNGETLNSLFQKNGNGQKLITNNKNKDLVNILNVNSLNEYLNDSQGRTDYYKGIINQFHKGNGSIEDIIEEVK